MSILLVVLLLLVCVVAYASTKPDDFSVAREMTMPLPAEKIFPHVNGFHKWNDWSPWAKIDPNCKNTFGGADSGKGATFAWDGNSKVGAGKMEITNSAAPARIDIKIDFLKPFKGTNDVIFTFTPVGTGTAVNWSMKGKQNIMMKVMSLFMNCEKMVGPQYEQGLKNLQDVASKS